MGTDIGTICDGECGVGKTCCEYNHTILEDPTEKKIELYLIIGDEIYTYYTSTGELRYLIRNNSACQHITNKGCALPRKERAYYCIHFPTEGNRFLPKKCKFYNTKKHYAIEEMNRILSINDFKKWKEG